MLPARSLLSRSSSAERPARRAPRVRAAIGFAGLSLAAGCYLGDNALPPPTQGFYFPTGIVVSPGKSRLYVTSSDFDLQYNGGTVLGLNLNELRTRLTRLLGLLQCTGDQVASDATCDALDPGHTVNVVRDACAAVVLGSNIEALLHPGPCSPFPVLRVDASDAERAANPGSVAVMSWATIGAFASGAIIVDRPTTGDVPGVTRMFLPVRGDPSITFFDMGGSEVADPVCDVPNPPASCADTQLNCDATGDDHRCSDDHRIGLERDRYANSRGLTFPVEPVGIAASEDGVALVTAHQTERALSLSINRGGPGDPTRPTIEFTLNNLADGPTEVATLPTPAYIKARLAEPQSTFGYQPGFLVSYRAAPEVDLVRYTDDAHAAPQRAFLTRVFQAAVTVNADGKDSRGLVVDPSARKACEASCAVGDTSCLQSCVKVPLRIFLANRTPATLLVGKVDTTLIENIPEGGGDLTPIGAFDKVSVDDSIPLAFGASKVAIGHVIDKQGHLSLRVFASAFDSRLVFSYDPEARRIDAVIRTGRGPHALAFDTSVEGDGNPPHSFLFVGHFTDSYLGVVDLDMRHPDTFGTIFASVGTPTPPRESK